MKPGHKGFARVQRAAALTAALLSTLAHGNPVGPQVVNGQASFATRGGQLSITNTPGTIINWQQFSINAGETTRFIQQSAASSVLNRVVGVNPSILLGTLQSNGRVFLLNPNGILFGAGSTVDVAGLVASTLRLSNADFLAGRMDFTGDPALAAAVVNQGRIAATSGPVYLVGAAVDNQGVVTTPGGDVVLAAGQSVRVTNERTARLQVEIVAPENRALNLSDTAYGSRGIYAGLVRNSGTLAADSVAKGADGRIVLKASRDVTLTAGSAVSASGSSGGSIVVEAKEGTASIAGTVSAAGSDGRGGDIAITGARTALLDGARVDASGGTGGGTVLVGGDVHGAAILDGDIALRVSQNSEVAAGAQIAADARESGNGGKVIVWADDTTTYLGAISARGGKRGGDGGFVEVSGKGVLDFRGTVDLRAPLGATGTLLLDPTNVYIAVDQASATAAGMAGNDTTADTGSGGNPNTFAASGAVQDSLLTTGNLNAALASANVIVTTANPAGTSVTGDITVVDPVAWASTNSLTLTAANNIAINAGITTGAAGSALILNAAGNVTQSAAIGGAGGVTQNGAGIVTLSQANNYTGPTTVNAGTLALGASNAIANSSSLVVNGGNFDLGVNNQTLSGVQLNGGSIIGSGALTSTSAFDLRAGAVSAKLAGAAGLNKTTAGTVTLSGANNYTGTTTISGGTLSVSGGSAISDAGAVVLANVAGATLDLGNNETIGSLAGGGTTGGNVNINGNTLTVGDASSTTYAGVISGAGGITKVGTGMLALSGANTYAGATAINAGTLSAQNAAALGTTAAGTTVAAGATLDINNAAVGNEAVAIDGTGVGGNGALTGTGAASLSGNITLGATTPTIGGTGTLTLSGVIVDGAGTTLTKTGAGTVTLAGTSANTYSGLTTVNAGTLNLNKTAGVDAIAGNLTVNGGSAVLQAANQINDGSAVVASGGTLDVGAGGDTVNSVQLTSGGSILGSGGTLTSTLAFDLQAGTVSANLGGTAGANKTGVGTVTLSGANSYTGTTTVSNGTLSVANAGALNAASSLIVNGGTLDINNVTLNNLASFTVQGTGFGGVGALTGSGAGAQYSGPVAMANATTIGGAGTLTLAGVISDGGNNYALTKAGAGTVTFAGGSANTYTGLTTVNAGTLNLNKSAGVNAIAADLSVAGGSAVLQAANQINDSATATISAGSLNIGANNETVNSVVLNGGSIAGTTGTLTSTLAFDFQSGSASAKLGGTAGANKTSGGTVSLSGANTYTGTTTVSAGTLSVANAAALNAATSLVVNGGTLDINNVTLNTLSSFTMQGIGAGGAGALTGTGASAQYAGPVVMTNASRVGGTGTLTVSGVVSDGGNTYGLTKVGGGIVALTALNTYTGPTTINAGVLSANTLVVEGAGGGVASSIGASGNAAANLVLGGGTLRYTGGSVATDRNFTLTAGTTSGIDVSPAAANLTWTGTSANTSGALTKLGAGTLTLTGANQHTGLTTVNAGTLAYGASDVLASGPVTVDGATAVLALGNNQSDTVGTVTVANGGSITGTGTSTLTSTGTFEMQSGSVSAILAGAGTALNKTTGSSVTLSGKNTYTGLTTISAGTLFYGTDDAIAAGPVTVAGGTLDIGPYSDSVGVVTLSSGVITGTFGTLTSTFFDVRQGTINAILTGSATLTKSTPGTVILTRANTYTGPSNINGGVLQIGADNNLGAAPAVATPDHLTFDGGTLNTTASFALDPNRGMTFNAGGGSFDTNPGTTLSYSGIAAGTGALTKIDTGTLVLGGVNTYTGATNINGGVLQISADNNLGTAPGAPTPNQLTFNGGTLNTTATFALNSNRGMTFSAGGATFDENPGTTLTYNGAATGAGTVTKVDTGTLVLGGTNTYTGTTTVNGGTLRLANGNAIVDTGAVVLANTAGAILDLTTSETIGNLSGGGTTGGNVTLNGNTLTTGDAGSTTYSGAISGTGGLTKQGSGVFTLAGASSYSGATNVNAGTLAVTNANALGATGTGTTVAGGATLNLNNVALVAEPVTLNGNGVGGAGALTATGTSSLAGDVALASASTIAAPAASDALTLGGTLSGGAAGTLSGAGVVTLAGAVGNSTPLASLTDNAGLLNINGGLVRTTGAQAYNAAVVTGGATTLVTTAGGSVSMNGAINATAGTLTLDTGAGNATLNNPLNNFGTVQVASGGTVSLVDANSVTIGPSTMGKLSARAAAGNLTLGGNLTATGGGTSIELSASGNFNNAGGFTLNPGPGRFLVWSTNPAADNRSGLAYNFKQYGATFGVSPVLGAGNGFLYTVAPTVTPSLTGSVAKVYDGTTAATLAPANYTFAGVIDGDTITLGNATNGTYGTANVGTNLNVSIAGLTLAGASNGAATVYGYTLGSTSANANIGTITQAPLTVTANNQSKTYGNAFAFTGSEFTPAGLKNGETIGSVTLVSAGTPATAHVAGGPYAINASAATGGTFTPSNYAITYMPGTLTVNPAALGVTANNQVKAYGTPVTFNGTEFTSSGLKNGETIGSVTLTSAATSPTASVMGSPYPIVASAATGGTFTASDYTITYTPGVFTVNPAGVALTVTASNVTKTYGTTYVFTGNEFTATGLMNGETIGSATLSSPGAAANAPVAGNPYVITPTGVSGGTFQPGNYTITYVNGTMTVVPAALTIRADNKSRLPGQPDPMFTATYTGFQLGETPAVLTSTLGYTTTATRTSVPGRYPIVASGQSSTNYAITYIDGTFTVQTPASLLEDTWTPLLAALRRLGIEDYAAHLADCASSGAGTGSAMAAMPLGVAAKARPRCGSGGAGGGGLVVELPRAR